MCQNDQNDQNDQEELQAMLHDAPLTQVPAGATGASAGAAARGGEAGGV